MDCIEHVDEKGCVARLYCGDSLAVLKTLPDKMVQTCVTSPPYYGLRDYGVEGQVGLEKTPEEYIAHLVEVFREVHRVLRDDGTLWVNMGDSYASRGGPEPAQTKWQVDGASATQNGGRTRTSGSLKHKDLIGIPWMLAFALRADGWYLRSDIIWHKPNAMPESVRDRPTKVHEYIFLLTKSAKYYYDAEAVKEENADPTRTNYKPGKEAYSEGNVHDSSGRKRRNDGFQAYAEGKICHGRNRRTVWTVMTKPYAGAHFATFPPDLVEPCVLAGTSERGVCPVCNAPWERLTERTSMVIDRSSRTHKFGRTRTSGKMVEPPSSSTIGWKPTCVHDVLPVPATVLDPFCGSSTTGAVARKHGRHYIGIDLNPDYLLLSQKRMGIA